MGAIITETILREQPELVNAFTGLPEKVFWSLLKPACLWQNHGC